MDTSKFLPALPSTLEVKPEESNVIAPPMAFEDTPADLQNILDKALYGDNLPGYMRSKNARDIFQTCFELIGGVPRLAHWGNKNPDKFYNLYSKLVSLPPSDANQPVININLSW